MRLGVAVVCATVLCGTGCQVGYKTAAGGAMSTGGLGKGTTRSLEFSDEGFLLTRLGLGFLAVGVASGSIENAKSESTVSTVGGNTVVTTKQSATINTGTLGAAQKIADAANGPRSGLSGAHGGVASRLSIAAQTLGGDTSGWQYDFGYNLRWVASLGPLGFMARTYLGLGYGTYKFHDRVYMPVDRGPPRFGDGQYGFGGLYGRIGAFFIQPPKGLSDLTGLETYMSVSLNARDHSMVTFGQRLQIIAGFVEAEVQIGGSSADERSYALQIGAGF